MRLFLPLAFLAPVALSAALPPLTPLPAGKPAAVEKHLVALSPADELQTIQLPDGYKLELVLSERSTYEWYLAQG